MAGQETGAAKHMGHASGIELTTQGHLARVTICQAGKFNAMSRAMWRELKAVFIAIQADPGLRCVLLRGQGEQFCAGGDISEYPSFRFHPGSLHEFHELDVWGGLQAMLDCDVPIVALIQGYCMGAGLEMACCCDLRVAQANARFGAPIAHLGFPMAPREAQLVLREVGATTAREMLLSAAVLDAHTLLMRGFLNKVLPDDQAAVYAESLAERLLRLAPQAARMNKQTLRALRGPSALATQWIESNGVGDEPWHPAYSYAASVEHKEGVEAFVQRRKPQFHK